MEQLSCTITAQQCSHTVLILQFQKQGAGDQWLTFLTSCCLTKSVTNTLCWDMRRRDRAEGSPWAGVPVRDWLPCLLFQKHI